MSVRKRILPSGETRWLVDYRDDGGARRFKQFKTRKEAEAFRDKTGVDVRAGVHTADAASVTVKQASELWLQRCKLGGLEAGTLRTYGQHINHHILPFIGKMKLSRLSRPQVESFKDKLLETRSQALSVKVLTTLKSVLSDAQRRGLVAQNAATGCKVKALSRHEKRIVIPTKDEIRAMLTMAGELWAVTSPWRPLIVTAIFTGLRASELRGLTWVNVDFDQRIIRIRQRADFQNKMGSPKSKAGTRDVPLAPMVLNALRQWRLACPSSELGLVFPTSRGGVISQVGMGRMWHELLGALDLSGYRFHDLRHAAASLFIEQGWQAKKVMAIMGHSSVQMTFDLYGHLWATPEDDATAMAQIEARLLR